jgi:RNase P/RNase MRP subunit p30
MSLTKLVPEAESVVGSQASTRLALWKRKGMGDSGEHWGMPVCVGKACVVAW